MSLIEAVRLEFLFPFRTKARKRELDVHICAFIRPSATDTIIKISERVNSAKTIPVLSFRYSFSRAASARGFPRPRIRGIASF